MTSKEDASLVRGILLVVDHVLGLGMVAPLVVLHWWASWTLLDHYFFPQSFVNSLLLSLAIGLVGVSLICILQDVFEKYFTPESRLLSLIFNDLHTLVVSFVIVNHWRGVWYLWDHYHGVSTRSALISALGSVLILALLRSFKNCRAAPVLTCTDVQTPCYTYTTRFKCKWKDDGIKFIFDSLFTVVIIHTIIISYWRGFWTFCNIYFFPDNPHKNAFYGLILGYSVAIIAYLMQHMVHVTVIEMQYLKYPALLYTLVEDGFTFIFNAAAVLTWRGLWSSYALYFLPWFTPERYWVGQFGAVSVMMLTLCAKTLLPIGCELDGEKGVGAKLQIEYIRDLVRWKESLSLQSKLTKDPKEMNNEVGPFLEKETVV